jgi:hypothetical protein
MTRFIVGALLCLGVVGCAGSGTSVSTHQPPATHTQAVSRSASAGGYLAGDLDKDRDDRGDKSYSLKPSDGEDTFVSANDGKKADPTVTRDVTALVKRYYAAAAAENSALACALLDPALATGLAEGEEQPGYEGRKTCLYAVAPVLKQQHRLLAEDNVATMTVIEVRTTGEVGTAIVGFRTMPVGTIRVKRDHGVWKMDALIDTGTT